MIPIVSLASVFRQVPTSPRTAGRKKSSHCRRGHALVDGNLYYYPGGRSRRCRSCKDIDSARRWGSIPSGEANVQK